MNANLKLGNIILVLLFAVVLYLMYRILQPFLLSLFLAIVMFTLLAPVNDTIASRFGQRRSLAALTVCLGLTLVLVVPLVYLAFAVARQAGGLYDTLRDPQTLTNIREWANPETNRLFARIQAFLPGSFDVSDLWARLGEQAQAIAATAFAAMFAVLSGILDFTLNYVIAFVALFFLLRDSDYFIRALRAISPLDEKGEDLFVNQFRSVTNATVIGALATAAVQGLIGGVIYVSLGIPNALLWGTLSGLLSLVPVVGGAVIWIPLLFYLLVTGSLYKALILLLLQVLVVGSVDNFLRPVLIEGRVKMHSLVVFLSILGGISYFGILGIILGPLVFAIGLTFFEFYLDDSPHHGVAPDSMTDAD
jgi:predicted PurR-regulated permease PerM